MTATDHDQKIDKLIKSNEQLQALVPLLQELLELERAKEGSPLDALRKLMEDFTQNVRLVLVEQKDLATQQTQAVTDIQSSKTQLQQASASLGASVASQLEVKQSLTSLQTDQTLLQHQQAQLFQEQARLAVELQNADTTHLREALLLLTQKIVDLEVNVESLGAV